MVTLKILIAGATALIAVTALFGATFKTFKGSAVMKAEGDGGSNSGGNDDLGWGSGDIDLPF